MSLSLAIEMLAQYRKAMETCPVSSPSFPTLAREVKGWAEMVREEERAAQAREYRGR